MSGGWECCMRSFSIVFTVYFALVSLAFIAYGAFSSYSVITIFPEDVLSKDAYLAVPSLALLVIGFVIFIAMVFGCCAECRKISCCMETYAVLLLILAVVQLGLGIFCLVKQNSIEKYIEISVSARIIYSDLDRYADQINATQSFLECCGELSRSTFGNAIPLSCCENESRCLPHEVFPDGCVSVITDFTLGTNFIIGWGLTIVAITEFLAATFAITLSCAFWRGRRDVSWS